MRSMGVAYEECPILVNDEDSGMIEENKFGLTQNRNHYLYLLPSYLYTRL